ncbi:hypothetical protein KCU99_g4720, partial [Aureobasidium melanogenum]
MGNSQSVWVDLKAIAVQALVDGAKRLLTEELSRDSIIKYRSQGGILRAAFDDNNYSVVNQDTDNYVNVEFSRLFGYQWTGKYTTPPLMLKGTIAMALNDFVVASASNPDQTKDYIIKTFTVLLNDPDAISQLVNRMEDNAAAMVKKGNTDWETLKQQFWVPDHSHVGNRPLLYQFDLVSVYATAEDNQDLTFIQYIGAYYHVDPDSLEGKQRDLALLAISSASIVNGSGKADGSAKQGAAES